MLTVRRVISSVTEKKVLAGQMLNNRGRDVYAITRGKVMKN